LRQTIGAQLPIYMDPFNAAMLAVLAGMLSGMLEGLIRNRAALRKLKGGEPIYANLDKVVGIFTEIRTAVFAMAGYGIVFSLQFELSIAAMAASIGGITSLIWARWTIKKAIAEGSKVAMDGWVFAIAYMIECLGSQRVKPSLYGMALAKTLVQIAIAIAAAYSIALITTAGTIGIITLLLNAVIVPAAFVFGFAAALTVAFLIPDASAKGS
jgi:hypothetical protein